MTDGRPGWRAGGVRLLVLLVLAALAAWFIATFAVRHGFFDLKVYYGAIRYWAGGHGDVYDYLKPGTKYGFTYPPFAALTMLPMAVLPWQLVITVATVATLVATLVLLDWFLRPVIARTGWRRWYTLAVALVLVVVLEPVRETISFGQVNLLLVALVFGDYLLLIRRGRGAGGVGIGLAAAIKLTPAVFVLYLLLARRWRAAAVAAGTAAGASVLAMAIAPDASRIFWTEALWDTTRVGTLSFISNQSLQGFVARLHPRHPSTALWAALVLATLALAAWRCVKALRVGDELTGFALTGVVGCLISPVTWVHHLVWLLPALLLLVDRALAATGRRRLVLLGFAVGLYALLCSRLVWPFNAWFTGWGLLGSNAYVIASLLLLAFLPVAPRGSGVLATDQAAGVPELADLDSAATGQGHRKRLRPTVDREAGPLVEPARTVVGREHP